MKKSQHFLENAENCAQLAERRQRTSRPTIATSEWKPRGERWPRSRTGLTEKFPGAAEKRCERQEPDAGVRPPPWTWRTLKVVGRPQFVANQLFLQLALGLEPELIFLSLGLAGQFHN